MPLMLDKAQILENPEKLRDIKWLFELTNTLVYAPGMTQAALEENLRTLRECYNEESIDGVFLEMFSKAAELFQKTDGCQETGLILRIPYTKYDFLYTDAPYREIERQKTPFAKEQVRYQLEEIAKSVGVSGFKGLCQRFHGRLESQVAEGRHMSFPLANTGEKIDLDMPEGWILDNSGIYKQVGDRKEYACMHPIAPVRRLTNIDTGMTKLMIAFERGGMVRSLIRDKRDLFDSRKIIELSDADVAVTSKTAANLSQFMCEIEHLNYDVIPEQNSVGRLGWLDNNVFSPFMEGIAFDGDASFGKMFSAIHESGDYDTWLQCAIGCRKFSITAQIMLAASFASVMLQKIGGLPFFVHLWGVDSETGKTVALMLAASVWGDPQVGRYVQTFRSTQVGHEYTANFLKNIPMCIDEKQLNSKFDVYQLAEGAGKARGNKTGGIAETPTWNLAILTTGETPLTSAGAGAGALNRVIDIECKAENKVIEDGKTTAKILRKHYGFAGKRFLEQLTPEILAEAEELHDKYYRQLQILDKTDKQSAPAALILTADHFADKLIFKTGNVLTPEKIMDFLKSKSEVSAGLRGYEYLCDWVALNAAKFSGDGNSENFGVIECDTAYINRTVFRKACAEGGYNESAVLSWLKTKNLIETRGRAMTKSKRIGGVRVECVVMQLPAGEQEADPFDELL